MEKRLSLYSLRGPAICHALVFRIGASSQRLVIQPRVLETFDLNRQLSRLSVEAGGQLFARVRDNDIVLELATGPRATDRRGRYSYIPDREAEQSEIDQWYSRGLRFVGDWHTHPERQPNPSLEDRRSIVNAVKESVHNLNGFLLAIAGTDPFPEGLWIGLYSTTEALRLEYLGREAFTNPQHIWKMTVKHQQLSSASNLLDRYSRNARLYPALLVIAPIVPCVISVADIQFSWIMTLETAAAAVGGTYLLAQLARDPGKARERELFEKWGGKPSVTILRHSDTRIDAITKSRYHSRLCALVPGTIAPTVESELANTAVADASYVAWSNHLRNSTRDQRRFPLVFEELVAYGYRRNLFGLRPIGMQCAPSVF